MFFFFSSRRRHTRYWRDWSSDVCSSDLDLINGRRVVLIDDSIVRGTTSKKIVRMVREAGAREVHMRISCPPTIGPCYYGVDTPNREELIAAQKSVEEIRRFIETDSLGYLSLEGMLEACGF